MNEELPTVSRNLVRELIAIVRTFPGEDDESLRQRADAMAALREPDFNLIASAEQRVLLYANWRGDAEIWRPTTEVSANDLQAIGRCRIVQQCDGAAFDPVDFRHWQQRPLRGRPRKTA